MVRFLCYCNMVAYTTVIRALLWIRFSESFKSMAYKWPKSMSVRKVQKKSKSVSPTQILNRHVLYGAVNRRPVHETGGFYDKIKRPRNEKCLQSLWHLLLHICFAFSVDWASPLYVQHRADWGRFPVPQISLCSIYRAVGGPNWRLVFIAFPKSMWRNSSIQLFVCAQSKCFCLLWMAKWAFY